MKFLNSLVTELKKAGDEIGAELDKAKPGLNALAKDIGKAVKDAEPTLNDIALKTKGALNELGAEVKKIDSSEGGKKINAAANEAGAALVSILEGTKKTTPERRKSPQEDTTAGPQNE